MWIIFLSLLTVAHTSYGDVDNNEIQVRIRVLGKPKWESAYVSALPGESLKLICQLISGQNSVSDDRLEWTKSGLLSTKASDFGIPIPINAKQRGNRSMVTWTSLNKDDTGIYTCKSKKYLKSDTIVMYVNLDLLDVFGRRGKLREPIIDNGGTKNEPIVNRGGAKDKPILNTGGAINMSVANWIHLTDDELEQRLSTLWKSHFDCTNDYFACVSDSKCVNFYKVCDGTWDCDDGSDESIMVCATESCAGKIRCNDGTCVSRDECAFSLSECCPEENIENVQYSYKSNWIPTRRQILIGGLCVFVLIKFAIIYLRRAKQSSEQELLLQPTIIQRPVRVDLERGGASIESWSNYTGQPIYDSVSCEAEPLNRDGGS